MYAVRFYRPDDNRTRVKGLVQVPFDGLQSTGDGRLSYAVSVRVSDSTGLTLYQQSWQEHARVAPGVPDAYTVEIVDFAIAPGRYRVEVGVKDSVSGRVMNSAANVQALSDSSMASDLLIAPAMRVATAEDTVPRPGEFRTGNSLVTAAAKVILTPLRAKVFYLIEAYSSRGQQGNLSFTLKDTTGKAVIRTADAPVTVDSGGSVLKGQLDLTGLPPGEYSMTATLKVGTRTTERKAELEMSGLEETLVRDTTRRAAERETDEGYFAQMPPDELNQAEAPLIYEAGPGELSVWSSTLSLEAKRRFLSQFWMKRDPTPGTPKNERREAFYGAIASANRLYREGGRNPIAGWRSDRGRIYIKNGTPDQVLRRQQEGRAPPYEVWSYAKGKGLYYIFADRSGFGAFTLMHSNDLKEPGLPGWAEVLGAEAVDDIGRFLGVDLLTPNRRF
jgi:GWxTD domain-containing protein